MLTSSMRFTIHFATINTKGYTQEKVAKRIFTIHFATINTELDMKKVRIKNNLQYTLLLLIHNG